MPKARQMHPFYYPIKKGEKYGISIVKDEILEYKEKEDRALNERLTKETNAAEEKRRKQLRKLSTQSRAGLRKREQNRSELSYRCGQLDLSRYSVKTNIPNLQESPTSHLSPDEKEELQYLNNFDNQMWSEIQLRKKAKDPIQKILKTMDNSSIVEDS